MSVPARIPSDPEEEEGPLPPWDEPWPIALGYLLAALAVLILAAIDFYFLAFLPFAGW
jgi:hypothetical protein